MLVFAFGHTATISRRAAEQSPAKKPSRKSMAGMIYIVRPFQALRAICRILDKLSYCFNRFQQDEGVFFNKIMPETNG